MAVALQSKLFDFLPVALLRDVEAFDLSRLASGPLGMAP